MMALLMGNGKLGVKSEVVSRLDNQLGVAQSNRDSIVRQRGAFVPEQRIAATG